MALPTGDTPITKANGSSPISATPNVVSLLSLNFDRNDPATYLVFIALLTVILLVLAQWAPKFAVGLALTVVLAVAFSHK